VDAAYKTHWNKVQSFIRLKIVWNGSDVYIRIRYEKFDYKTNYFDYNL